MNSTNTDRLLYWETVNRSHLPSEEKTNLHRQLLKREEHVREIDPLIQDVKRSALMLEKIFQNF